MVGLEPHSGNKEVSYSRLEAEARLRFLLFPKAANCLARTDDFSADLIPFHDTPKAGCVLSVKQYSVLETPSEPNEILSVIFRPCSEGQDCVRMLFNLHALGCRPPAPDIELDKLGKLLQEIGNVVQRIPRGLDLDDIRTELLDWVGLEPIK